jgi:hypothetical protein
MATKKETALAPANDPFALLRQMTSDFDRAFEGWPSFRWPAFRAWPALESAAWLPKIEVFEKDSRLVTKVDLPGMKKEDVKVEVTTGLQVRRHDVLDLHGCSPYAALFAVFAPSWISIVRDVASAFAGSGTLTSNTPSANAAFTSSSFAPSGSGTAR